MFVSTSIGTGAVPMALTFSHATEGMWYTLQGKCNASLENLKRNRSETIHEYVETCAERQDTCHGYF